VKKTLIFSDVHLKVTGKDKVRQGEFIAFLRRFSPEEYERMICLGDLFDFWFEYKHVIFSDYFEVLRVFADWRDAGMEMHLVCGNHDFWAGRFLRDELQFQVYTGETRMTFGDKTALLYHGDGINTKDYGYRIYKHFARNRLVIGAFRLLHPDWAMTLARGVSHGSRSITRAEDTSKGPEARALREHARRALAQGDADIIMCGHAHDPVMETCPTPSGTGLYINTGDWLDHRSYVVWDGAEFSMHHAEERDMPVSVS